MMAIEWRTEQRNVASLKDYPKNPRIITEKGIADLKASITKLGYIDPIAVNLDGTIIGGHARKQTLLALGLKEIDVRVPSRQLTDKEVDQAIIRLNKNIAGTWDFKVLEDSFDRAELIEWGFEKSEFNVFGSSALKTDPDELPITPSNAVTVPGDKWLMGDHALQCGDSTDAAAVAGLLAGATPNLMVTDPPYGVNYDPTWRDAVGGKFGDGRPKMRGKVDNDDRADWTAAWQLFMGDIAYVWHGALHSPAVAQSLESVGMVMRTQVIWVKQHFAFGRGDYHWQHEPCWYAVRKGKKGNWHGGRKQTTVWAITGMNAAGAGARAEEDTKSNHSTQKPVECMKRPIENNSKPGDAIYEPFSGSGTTIIAAEITGRKAYAMEINPLYVDIAVLRWQKFTGKKAMHAVTGKPFDTDIDVRRKPKRKGKAA